MLRPLLLLALLLAFAAPVTTQTRPLLTEPATTAPAGTFTFESGVDAMRLEPNFLHNEERNVWAGPLLRWVYSPHDDVELDVQWVARVGQSKDPVFGTSSDWGDVTLRAKWRFKAEEGRRPAMGVRLAVSLPETEASEGLGPNTLRMSADWLITKSLGHRFWFHGNAGLAVADRPQSLHAQSDFLAFGAALEQRVNNELDLVAEVAGQAGEGDPGADQHIEARIGARFGKGLWRGDAALRRGLSVADGEWGFTAGVIVVLHKPRPKDPPPS